MKKKFLPTFLVQALLLFFLLQCLFSMIHISSTSDEVAHLPAGYAYLKTGDFKLNPEHPPLVKILAAYPLLFLDLPDPLSDKFFIENEKWEYGKSLLYHSGESAEKILFLGRLVVVLLGLFLALIVYTWSKELFGRQGGLFSLFLFAFEPNLIAHSRLVTTDVGFSLFFLLSIFWMWRYFQRPSFQALILCGLSSGLAFSTKFSAILLGPIILTLLGLEMVVYFKRISGQNEHLNALKPFVFFIMTLPVLILLIVAASYGFLNIRYYLIGLKSVLIHSQMGHAAFLAGQYTDRGWWYYFPLAFLIKTPVPLLLLLAASLLLMCHHFISLWKRREGKRPCDHRSSFKEGRKGDLRNWAYLMIPPLLFFLFTLISRLNIGVRHILPLFPFVIILCGIVFKRPSLESWKQKKIISFILIFLSIWYVSASIFIFPHYLSYFNELIGGPSYGYQYLVDSNLDWGQDLPDLKKFLAQRGIRGVILCYFGNADPYYYGISYQYLPLCGKPKIPSNYHPPSDDFDYIAISATHLQSVFTYDHHCFDWLKRKKPYARIGYTIFLYDIKSDAEAHQRLAENYLESKMYVEAQKHLMKAQALRAQNRDHEKF